MRPPAFSSSIPCRSTHHLADLCVFAVDGGIAGAERRTFHPVTAATGRRQRSAERVRARRGRTGAERTAGDRRIMHGGACAVRECGGRNAQDEWKRRQDEQLVHDEISPAWKYNHRPDAPVPAFMRNMDRATSF